MTEERPSVKVTIFGNEYTIRGEAKEDYIQSLAKYVDEKMKEIGQGAHLSSPLKISILAAINMADEIFRLRRHLDTAVSEPEGNKTEADQPELASVAPEAISALAAHIDAALKEE